MTEILLTCDEVAAKFAVHSKTVRRWANAGKLPVIMTPGGGYRFRRADMERIFAAQHDPARV